jgi:hypothetical protein
MAKSSGTSLSKAFEKSIHAAFTILGYDTKLLGQGMGRVPDGLAVEPDSSYAILWDAKVREGGYSMGTDDRAIREYVNTQSRELKRRRSLRNIYYARLVQFSALPVIGANQASSGLFSAALRPTLPGAGPPR